jgi:hypothetical protein
VERSSERKRSQQVLEAAAYHEAGHAVAAFQNGIRLAAVWNAVRALYMGSTKRVVRTDISNRNGGQEQLCDLRRG